MTAPRVTVIHALAASMEPIANAFARLWPEAALRSILDDGLSRELAATGRLDARMTARFLALGRLATADQPDAILFTCSAFGPCIEAVQRDLAPLPVHKPNTAMIEAAARLRGRLALVASFAPTLETLPLEIPASTSLVSVLVPGGAGGRRRGGA